MELSEVIMMKALNVPVAQSYFEFGDVPARIRQDMLILQGGISDFEEWQRLNPKG